MTNLGDRNNAHMHEHALNFHEDLNRMDANWVLWEDDQEKAKRFFPMVRR